MQFQAMQVPSCECQKLIQPAPKSKQQLPLPETKSKQ
jgi:hypothetical protein